MFRAFYLDRFDLKLYLNNEISIFVGIHLPRGAIYDDAVGYKSRLPSPRKISTLVFQNKGNGTEDVKHTHMLMQFGQMIDHELTSTTKIGNAYGHEMY